MGHRKEWVITEKSGLCPDFSVMNFFPLIYRMVVTDCFFSQVSEILSGVTA